MQKNLIKPGKDLVIRNCAVIDVSTGRTSAKKSVHISRGRIVAIEEGEAYLQKTIVIDAAGTYCIPGLVDAHCHSTMTSVFAFRPEDLLRHMEQLKHQYALCIESGITTIRDVGAFPGLLRYFMKKINRGSMKGPRIVYANAMINVMGGHPDVPQLKVNVLASVASLIMGVPKTDFRDSNELKKVLEKHTKHASLIKVTMDNRSLFCRKDPIPTYTDEHLAYIFNVAEKKGLPVSGHCMRKWGFDRAMDYPFHSLEHVVSDELLTNADIKKMVKRNIALIPTMIVGQSYCIEEAYDSIPRQYRTDFIMNELAVRRDYFQNEAGKHQDPYFHGSNIRMLGNYKRLGWDKLWDRNKFLVNPDLFFSAMKRGVENLKRLREAGVLMAMGIDAGMPFCYFGGQYRELELLSRIGFSALEILQIATINGAKILRLDNEIGTIEKGKRADLVLLDKNPLKNIRAYRDPVLVVKDGTIVHGQKRLVQIEGLSYRIK